MQPLFYISVLLIWAKTYAVQKLAFTLPVEGWYQELILLITPLSSTLLMLAFSLVLARKKQPIALLVVSFGTSFILFANMIFYRFFNDFITLPLLFQSKNMGALGGSILELLHPYDVFVFLDVAVIAYLVFRKKRAAFAEAPLTRTKLVSISTLAIAVFFVNWTMAEVVRPELFTRTFDRQIMVKSIGTFNYHLYDAVVNSRMTTKKVFASSEDLMDANQYLQNRTQDELDPELFGVAEGRNVFLISLESLQSFAIHNDVYGEEVTPFLNRLAKDSFYFENFYEQTGQGKTSDAEFMVDNSLYPLPSGAVYFTHANNSFNAVPSILRERGYYSAVFHANDKTFWNRDLMYQALGYDHFFSVTDYEVTEENSVGWGLKDIDFFMQSMDKVKALPQPFYTKWITLTNHYPFDLDEEDHYIAKYDSDSNTLNKYFTTVRYLDESIKVFFEQVKDAGLYDNSIFVLYGDHHGISSNHNRSLAKYLGKETITPLDQVELHRVPLIIHIPGMEGRSIDTVSGQIDLKPTILHLLGLETEHGLDFGHDLFAKNHPQIVVMRDGSFVTQDVVYTQEECYSKETREAAEDAAACESVMDKAIHDLRYSDEIIYGDLLRFMLTSEE